MNKIITIGLITMLLLVFGCATEEITPPGTGETTITQTDEAISEADNTLEDLEDTETEIELDNIEKVLEQI